MGNGSDISMHYGAKARLFQFAQDMRKSPTRTEQLLWDILNAPQSSEYKFRRQHPLATFIADFYSHPLKLVIEVDGGYHLNTEQQKFDSFRDSDMNALGISVLRFSNEDLLYATFEVQEKISEQIKVLSAKM